MDGERTFLESSTIHGLNFISTTRRYVRVFWILVVLAGFTTAAYLINTSFQAWADSPIKTTVETLPMVEIKFPKVTVCPPRNTYTDLNYDLMLAEKINLTKEMRDELIEYSKKVIDEHIFINDFEVLQEDDRYYNWYHGYSKIERTFTDDEDKLNYDIYTSATSGVVTTQYYGEQYQPNIVKRKAYFKINVYPPESVKNSKNVTLHYKLDKVSMTGLSKGWDNIGFGRILEAGLTSASMNFTPPDNNFMVFLERDNIIEEDFMSNGLESMPGFRLRWYYTGIGDNVTPDSDYSEDQDNQLFIW